MKHKFQNVYDSTQNIWYIKSGVTVTKPVATNKNMYRKTLR